MYIKLTDRASETVLINLNNADVICDSGDGHSILYFGKEENVKVKETVDKIWDMINDLEQRK